MKPDQDLPHLKTLILCSLAWLYAGTSAMAQLTMDVVFSNLGPTLDAPIYGLDGVTGLSEANFHAELIYDASPIGGSSTTLAASTSQWVQPGYFVGAIAKISGFTSGSVVTFYVRAWDDAGSGLTFDLATTRNVSNPVYLTVPDPPPEGTPLTFTLPKSLNGLQPFQLQVVPEPSASLVAVGLACALYAAARRLARSQASPPSARDLFERRRHRVWARRP